MDHFWHSHSAFGNFRRGELRPSEYLPDRQIYFSCEGDEPQLSKVIELIGANRLMVSADMPHAELRENCVQEIKQRTDITASDKEWILGKSAELFYKL